MKTGEWSTPLTRGRTRLVSCSFLAPPPRSSNSDCVVFLLCVSDVAAPVISVRGVAVESERFVSVKPDVQTGPGQQNHDVRAQRTYLEELRREPNTDK